MDNPCSPSLIIDDTHMLISSSVNQMAQLQPCRYSGFILSIVFHFTLVISYFYITQQRPVIIHQPAPAVMLSLSEYVQAVNKENRLSVLISKWLSPAKKNSSKRLRRNTPILLLMKMQIFCLKSRKSATKPDFS